MRIAMVHWAFVPVVGGVESHLATLGNELARTGLRVSLLTGSVANETHERSYGMDVERSPHLDLHRLRAHSDARADDVVRLAIGRFLDRQRPDVVHAHNMHYFSTTHLDALDAWCRLAAVPLVLTAHNIWADALARALSLRSPAFARVIAVSNYVARELDLSGYDKETIDVVHHGIDTARFARQPHRREVVYARYPEMRGRPIVFHPARSSVTKGSLVAIEALDRVRRRHPDVLLVCAGTGQIVDWDNVQGSELAAIRDSVMQLGLASNVLLRPFSWEEMADLYQVADVTVYPSINEEPFGIAVIEAMASGSPVIVTASGGMPEFVEDGVTGFVVPRHDAGALAHRIEEILDDPIQADAMALRARQAVVARHSVAEMARRTVMSYQRALASPRFQRPWPSPAGHTADGLRTRAAPTPF